MALPATIEALLLRNSRSVTPQGGTAIIPDVVVYEEHEDSMVITEHPVEKGAPISDHAYKQPETLTCRFAWSDSASLLNQVTSLSILSGLQTIDDVYQKFLDEMGKATLFDVSTGKRQYTDMVIASISVKTDEDTETALVMDVTFKKVNLVTITESDGSQTEAEQQANPEDTALHKSLGDKIKEKVSSGYDSVKSTVNNVIEWFN